MYLGNGRLQKATFTTSLIKKQFGRLQVKHIIEGNKILAGLINIKTRISLRLTNQNAGATVTMFSDDTPAGEIIATAKREEYVG